MIVSNPRIFCIGRNYVKHIEELKNEVPGQPVIFMKPYSSLLPQSNTIVIPSHGTELHHEAELVLKIGKTGRAETDKEALTMIEAYTLGLDLTLRDVQKQLKEKGLPWEIAKSFPASAPIGEFVPYTSGTTDLGNLKFNLAVNGINRQNGDTSLMLFPVAGIITYLSGIWELQEGDLIYTGTPAGVAQLKTGDRAELAGDGVGPFSWDVV